MCTVAKCCHLLLVLRTRIILNQDPSLHSAFCIFKIVTRQQSRENVFVIHRLDMSYKYYIGCQISAERLRHIDPDVFITLSVLPAYHRWHPVHS